MKIIKTTGKEVILFVELYFRNFDDYLVSLIDEKEEQKPEVLEFLTKEYQNTADAMFSKLTEMMGTHLMKLARNGQLVIKHSIKSGEFSFADYKEGIEKHQKDFLKVLADMKAYENERVRKNAYNQQLYKWLDAYFETEYQHSDLSDVRLRFLAPVGNSFVGVTEKLMKEKKVVSLNEIKRVKR